MFKRTYRLHLCRSICRYNYIQTQIQMQMHTRDRAKHTSCISGTKCPRMCLFHLNPSGVWKNCYFLGSSLFSFCFRSRFRPCAHDRRDRMSLRGKAVFKSAAIRYRRAPYNEIGQSPARRRQPGWQQVDLPLNSSHPWLARPSCFGPVSASEHLETCMTWHETVNAHPDFRADIIRRDELRPRMMLALVRLLDPLFSTFSLSSACSLEALEPRGCDCHKEELCVNLASGTGNFKKVYPAPVSRRDTLGRRGSAFQGAGYVAKGNIELTWWPLFRGHLFIGNCCALMSPHHISPRRIVHTTSCPWAFWPLLLTTRPSQRGRPGVVSA